jgi:hypothetical protein
MDELVSHSTIACTTNVTIERRHNCLTIGGEEEGRYGCSIGVVHRGIPHSEACPLVGGAHGDGQYPWPKGGGGVLELWPGWPTRGDGGELYAGGGSGGSHVKGCPAMGDPTHGITGFGPI